MQATAISLLKSLVSRTHLKKKKKLHTFTVSRFEADSVNFIESFRLETTFEIIKSVNLALPTLPLSHDPNHPIYTSFEYLQAW